jgi:cell shape-determining protein MreC
MSELEKLQFEVKRLREENENLRQTFTENFSDSTIVQKNAENIIMKAINMAYDIRIQLKTDFGITTRENLWRGTPNYKWVCWKTINTF